MTRLRFLRRRQSARSWKRTACGAASLAHVRERNGLVDEYCQGAPASAVVEIGGVCERRVDTERTACIIRTKGEPHRATRLHPPMATHILSVALHDLRHQGLSLPNQCRTRSNLHCTRCAERHLRTSQACEQPRVQHEEARADWRW